MKNGNKLLGHKAVVKALISAGADVNRATNEGIEFFAALILV